MAISMASEVPVPIGGRSRLLSIFMFLLVLALYVNCAKVFFESRYIILLADACLLVLTMRVLSYRLLNVQRLHRMEFMVGAFLVLGVLQVFNPNVPSLPAGLEGFRRTMYQMLAVFIGISAVRTRQDFLKLATLVTVASIPVLLYGVKQFFWMSAFDHSVIESNTAAADTWMLFGKIRAFSVFNGPFHLGLFAGLVFWLAVALFLEYRRKLYLAVAVAAASACLASLTRASVLALLLSVPVVLFYASKGRRRQILLVAVGMAAGLWTLLHAVRNSHPTVDLFIQSISSLERITTDSRFDRRFSDYQEAAARITRNPMGLGMGSAGDAMAYHFEPHNRTHTTSHNLFLRVALETGWLGLVVFLTILAAIVSAIRRLKKSGDRVLTVALSGLLGIVLLTGLTGSTIGAYPVNLLFWSLCGALVGLAGHREEEFRSE